jgi:uncharacterized protein YuzE
MKVYYDEKADLLCLRFDEEKRQVINKRVTEDVVLDIEDEDKIIGIEILDASKHVNLAKVLPIYYELKQQESAKSKT